MLLRYRGLDCKSPASAVTTIYYSQVTNDHNWFTRRAEVALEIRLAEDAAKAADKLIQHTEELTDLTATHIQHAQKLTEQTDILVTESRSLRKLNWALIILTVGLLFLTAGLFWVDWHREG